MFLLLFVLLGLLEQVLQHLGLLEPVIELGVLLLVLRLRAQQEDMVSISQEGLNGISLQQEQVLGLHKNSTGN
jgi:hypothetical protein